jgi:hypothetical protein
MIVLGKTMKFIIQYSKNAKFITKDFSKLNEKDQNRFKILLALRGQELILPTKTYRIQ